ncbi:MAG: hypothetical protein CMJ58_04100 [Planctomycetaceae bacterium]|nr:hypothetical protein [Planctomycetaceae bacterium]
MSSPVLTTARTNCPPDDAAMTRVGQAASARFSLRAFTSLLLTASFAVLCVSGVLLFLTPRGRTANWTGWTMWGLDKHEWGAVHVNNGLLFIAIAVTHLALNWSVLVRYLRNKRVAGINKKRELALAGLVAAVCVAGPIYGIPPFSSLMSAGEQIKDYWDETAAADNAEPPVPHAEEFTLAELAEHVGLSADEIAAALELAGYDTADEAQSVGEIAAQQGATPSELLALVRAAYPETRGWGRIGAAHDEPGEASDEQAHGPGRWSEGAGRGMGQGRGMGRGRGAGAGAGQGRWNTGGHAE